jgi:hypothetical protein
MDRHKMNLRNDQIFVISLLSYWIFLVLIMLSVPCFALADLEVGAGMSSAMSGRFVPGGTIAIKQRTWALSATAVGVQTPVYYQSNYTLAYYRTWKAGEFWWADLEAGLGVGAGYSQRGFRESLTAESEAKSQSYIGPALRLSWKVLNPIVFTLESIYGLGACSFVPPPLTHDLVMFSVGWRI